MLSATPMFNDYTEIIPVLNLILKKSLTFSDIDNVTSDKTQQYFFKQSVYGYISYLKADLSLISKTFIEAYWPSDFPQTIKEKLMDKELCFNKCKVVGPKLNLVSCLMSDIQTKEYLKAGQSLNEREKPALSIRFGNELFKNVDKYSCKYAMLLNILDEKKSLKQKAFVFSFLVQTIGTNALTKLLESRGYTNATIVLGKGKGFKKINYKRFVVLTSDVARRQQILTQFNKPDNFDGKHCRIILGSETIATGYTFKDIQQVHILGPDWHFSGIEQAIGRGIRFNSHAELMKQNNLAKVDVDIYLYAAIPGNNKWKNNEYLNSIDIKKYKTSLQKDLKIKFIERLLKEASLDCPLLIKRNTKDDDFTRECDYQKCEYSCDGVTGEILTDKQIHSQNYNLYYFSQNNEQLIKTIFALLSNFKQVSIQDIKLEAENLFKKKFTDANIVQTLLISNDIFSFPFFENKQKFNFYINENDNEIYLSKTLNDKIDVSLILQENNITLNQFANGISIQFLKNNEIEKLLMVELDKEKEMLLEESLLMKEIGTSTQKGNKIIDALKQNIKQDENPIITQVKNCTRELETIKNKRAVEKQLRKSVPEDPVVFYDTWCGKSADWVPPLWKDSDKKYKKGRPLAAVDTNENFIDFLTQIIAKTISEKRDIIIFGCENDEKLVKVFLLKGVIRNGKLLPTAEMKKFPASALTVGAKIDNIPAGKVKTGYLEPLGISDSFIKGGKLLKAKPLKLQFAQYLKDKGLWFKTDCPEVKGGVQMREILVKLSEPS